MSSKLLEIYAEEMRTRVEKLRLAMALARAADPKARADALYDAHLQAHNMTGTSQQLQFDEAAELTSAMSDGLERAREDAQLSSPLATELERGCAAIVTWLGSGRRNAMPLSAAATAMRTAVRTEFGDLAPAAGGSDA
jgi:hypothetical protein